MFFSIEEQNKLLNILQEKGIYKNKSIEYIKYLDSIIKKDIENFIKDKAVYDLIDSNYKHLKYAIEWKTENSQYKLQELYNDYFCNHRFVEFAINNWIDKIHITEPIKIYNMYNPDFEEYSKSLKFIINKVEYITDIEYGEIFYFGLCSKNKELIELSMNKCPIDITNASSDYYFTQWIFTEYFDNELFKYLIEKGCNVMPYEECDDDGPFIFNFDNERIDEIIGNNLMCQNHIMKIAVNTPKNISWFDNHTDCGAQFLLAEYLITLGADLNKALCYACETQYFEMVLFFIELGANDFGGALFSLCDNGIDNKTFDLIIEKGNLEWDYILECVCITGNIELVKLALKNGAINYNRGIISAIRNGNYDVAEFLYNLSIEKS